MGSKQPQRGAAHDRPPCCPKELANFTAERVLSMTRLPQQDIMQPFNSIFANLRSKCEGCEHLRKGYEKPQGPDCTYVRDETIKTLDFIHNYPAQLRETHGRYLVHGKLLCPKQEISSKKTRLTSFPGMVRALVEETCVARSWVLHTLQQRAPT